MALLYYLPLVFLLWDMSLTASIRKRQVEGGKNVDSKEKQMKYLESFGYMGEKSPDPELRQMSRSNPDQAFSTAVRMFQRYFDLEVTGEVNEETRTLMEMSRCGNMDVTTAQQVHELKSPDAARFKRYAFLYGGGWSKPVLTYKVTQNTFNVSSHNEIDPDMVEMLLARAFEVWSELIPLQFYPTTDLPDIEVLFASGDHGDGSPFDGPLGVLAHASFPFVGGDIHFDNDEVWTYNVNTLYEDGGISFLWTAVHEIGHAIGLGHSRTRDSIMFPYYSYQNESTFELDIDDIHGIQGLYWKMAPSPVTAIPEEGADFCKISSIDGAFTDQSGLSYFFKGNHLAVVDGGRMLPGYPRSVLEDFMLTPPNMDSAMFLPPLYSEDCDNLENGEKNCSDSNVPSEAFILFLKDEVLFINYVNHTVYDIVFVSSMFDGIQTPIDAAISDGGRYIYFMSGTMMQKWDRVSERFVAEGRRISSYEGLPPTIDAALTKVDGDYVYHYFFKDQFYYRVTEGRESVDEADPPYPRPIKNLWFGCPPDEGEPEIILDCETPL